MARTAKQALSHSEVSVGWANVAEEKCISTRSGCRCKRTFRMSGLGWVYQCVSLPRAWLHLCYRSGLRCFLILWVFTLNSFALKEYCCIPKSALWLTALLVCGLYRVLEMCSYSLQAKLTLHMHRFPDNTEERTDIMCELWKRGLSLPVGFCLSHSRISKWSCKKLG